MKKFQILFFAAFFSIMATSCEMFDEVDEMFEESGDRKIGSDQLPANILEYISTNHPKATVLYAEIDPDYTAYYEVELSNGLELYFDQDGNFLGLDDDDEEEESYKENGNGNVPQALVDKALAIFNGTVVYNDTYTENGVQLAEVTIQNEEGARVEFYFVQSIGEIYEIEAEKGPFNYEIEANADWIALSKAIELGCAAANSFNCNISEWELYNKSTRAFYEIDFANGAEVTVNAVNGDIISVEFDD